MEKKKRKKLSAKAFTAVLTPLLAVLLVFSVVLSVVTTSSFDLVLRDIFGETELKTGGAPEGVDAEYYTRDITDSDELQAAEQAYTRKAGAEGFVLLYNNTENGKGLPVAAGSKLSLFSASSVDLLAGGTGSGVSTISSDMRTALTEQGFSVNESLWKFYSDNHSTYTRGGGAIMYGGAEDWSINEAPISAIPKEAKDEAVGTTPVFFIARTGGEGRDLGRYMGDWTDIEEDKGKHYLEPDSVELGVIQYLNDNFDNVIIVVNTNNAFELGWVKDYENITAVLWAPGAGGDTCRSIADVLSGSVNPSGHLVDTFAYDAFSSPAMQNMGDMMLVNNGQDVEAGVFYDEGIYVGYKYYETRYFDKMLQQGNAGDYDYSQVVQYPFGYGLSYTTFEWSDFTMSDMDANGDIQIQVTVTNTGDVTGRDVVQVYLNAPYTEYDRTNHIEKSSVSLVGFEKTDDLEPGASETVTITVNQKDFISYDDVNAKTYILEAGDYLLTAAPNAHAANNNFLAYTGHETDGLFGQPDADFVDKWTYTYLDNNGVDNQTYSVSLTGVTVTNQFDHASYDELTPRDQYLTRQDWVGTFPTTHGNQDSQRKSQYSEKNGYTWEVEVSDTIRDAIKAKGASASLNPMTEEEAASMAGVYGQDGDLELIDFRGRDFDEVEAEGGWDALINQMEVTELETIIRNGGYQTLMSVNMGKPRAIDYDGPSGLNEGGITHEPYSITYPCATNLAASWDRENSYLHGYYVGEDALAADGNWGDHTYIGIISGWYAPAMNIHRTPFAGRNFEYYSEDGFMSGELALQAASACAEKGVYAYIKHFALNDQEDHRSHVATFANEQAIREIYLKPFQTCIEERPMTTIMVQQYDEATDSFTQTEAEIPAVMAVMSSFNRVGCTWSGGDYNLLTGVLRNEWGFDGTIITDYDGGGVMDTEQCIRAGGDLKLTGFEVDAPMDPTNPATQYFARQAIKHILYTTVNSNAMNGIVHGVAVEALPFANYYIILIVENVVAAALIIWGVVAIVRRWKKEKKAS
ncbi:MAG: glycoside hydrolase family 3 C-terminal domain-containing protein [Pseudoflavonifractor capillosus]|uniref:beta-glucosidase n=1 Tax=Pseudoflavonifractor capillosus TaxID=106588 RepID=UPI0023F80F62|nr:glycoside hydrolase family 3 N-terminal domain-containing protein [Pseudoflavonifractor capillosus]MCI5927816.1 glycoside hydrolase family 3 C-terminal domain-containing protein [Pseudoflavonifractor capillosus]MDY4661776.1 glycoside hydrolase family 3 N-terminal domain-containing protein [Pseudoflavonifractor capillosus]